MIEQVASSAFVRRDLRAAVVPWALARVVVLSSLAAARFVVDQLDAAERLPLHQGLFGWDATFYRLIAEHGYAAVGEDGLRFFPLTSLLARGLGFVLVGNTALALLVIVNGAALLYGALLHRLVLVELHDLRAARRAVWFGSLVPPAVVLVMGYAEALLLALGIGVFLALRTGRFWWAAVLGVLAGLGRPFGLLLVIPVAIEVARTWRTAPTGGRVARAAALAGPPFGATCYLAWAQRAYDDFWLPVRVQGDDAYRGDFVDPVSRTFRAIGHVFDGDLFDSGRALLWLAVLVVLVAVLLRHLPASYGAYAAAVVVVALSSDVIQSFERYATSAFPFAIGFALVSARVEVERTLLIAFGAGLTGYSVLAFIGVLVP